MTEPDCSELQFKWGKKRGIGSISKSQYYESFTFDEEEYSLYDCVYLFKEGDDEPYVGKIIKIWGQDNSRKVRILWFFLPREIRDYLGDYVPMEKEIFLAAGEGKGLLNDNPVEAICGKCSVICTSKDERNPQPSEEALESADYIFYCTFDVKTCTISDKLADKIAGVEVKLLLNLEKHNRAPISKNKVDGLDDNGNVDTGKYVTREVVYDSKPFKKKRLSSDSVKSSDYLEKNKKAIGMRRLLIQSDEDDSHEVDVQSVKDSSGKMKMSGKNFKSPDTNLCDDKPCKRMRLNSDLLKPANDLGRNKSAVSTRKVPSQSHEDYCCRGPIRSIKESSGTVKLKEKNTKPFDESLLKVSAISAKKKEKSETQVLDATRRPETDKSKWFKEPPWEGRMKKANERGTLVFLDNIDRSFTRTDLEDIMCRLFDQTCTVKVIPQLPFLSPHFGQAYVIFKTPDAANEVVGKLNAGCLMQPNGRPFVASKGMLPMAPKISNIHGHLSLERRFQMQREEMRKAVSTSHCSQPNTIEYELAMEWILLQEKYHDSYGCLYKVQGDEIKEIKSNLKANV